MVATTLRMPDKLHERLKAKADTEGRSINEIAVEILERELRRQEWQRILAEADRLQEEIRATHGELPDSTEIIRELREERSNRV